MNLTIQLPDEHAAALKAQAEANDMSVSEAIRLSLEASGLIEAS